MLALAVDIYDSMRPTNVSPCMEDNVDIYDSTRPTNVSPCMEDTVDIYDSMRPTNVTLAWKTLWTSMIA